jgi:diadenylate cyclase
MLLVIVMLSSLLGLTSLNWLLTNILNNGAVVLLILFQPEIRKGLEKMGRSNLFNKGNRKASDQDSQERIVQEIIQTMLDLSQRRVGALICFEGRTGLQDFIDTGTRVDGEISAPLLENIFEPNTPLHDGAVIVRGDKVVAAQCILPVSHNLNIPKKLGLRHRSAIGVTENYDAIAIVVSEETGSISAAIGGKLMQNLDARKLEQILAKS